MKINKLLIIVLLVAAVSYGQTMKNHIAVNCEETKDTLLRISELENTLWKTEMLLGFDEATHYTMNLVTPDSKFRWGNFVKFGKDNFKSYYSAPCGNDCFRSVYGHYEAYCNLLIIKVDSVTFQNDCYAPTEYRNSIPIKFDMVKNGSVINLVLIENQ